MLVLVGISFFVMGYIAGLERGMRLDRVGKILPEVKPLLNSFGRREKRRPKSVSEFDQWKKEQGNAPADPI